MPRAPKICGSPDCNVRSNRRYCPEHEAQLQKAMDAKRGNFRARGYDSQHTREAVQMKARAVAEHWTCPRCGQPILAGQKLDYGHTIARINGGGRASQVEHSHCNRQAQHRFG